MPELKETLTNWAGGEILGGLSTWQELVTFCPGCRGRQLRGKLRFRFLLVLLDLGLDVGAGLGVRVLLFEQLVPTHDFDRRLPIGLVGLVMAFSYRPDFFRLGCHGRAPLLESAEFIFITSEFDGCQGITSALTVF